MVGDVALGNYIPSPGITAVGLCSYVAIFTFLSLSTTTILIFLQVVDSLPPLPHPWALYFVCAAFSPSLLQPCTLRALSFSYPGTGNDPVGQPKPFPVLFQQNSKEMGLFAF